MESSTWVFEILDSCFEGKKYESSRRSSCCERDDLGGFLVGSNSWVDEVWDDDDDDDGNVLHGFKVYLKVCNNDDIANRSRCQRESKSSAFFEKLKKVVFFRKFKTYFLLFELLENKRAKGKLTCSLNRERFRVMGRPN